MGLIGSPIRRSEDLRLVRGAGRFAADVQLKRMLHACVVRSSHAHARVLGIEVDRARRMPGVVEVLTFQDIAGVKPIPMRLTPFKELERATQYPLAGDRVRYVGDPVAVVVADSRYAAEDAADLVQVHYEALDPLVDARTAVEAGAIRLHDAVPENIAARFITEFGQIDRGLAESDEVIEEEFYVQRHSAIPLETRGLVAEYDEGRDVLTVWGPAKVVHFNHGVLAELLGMPENRIRLVEPDVGGGFGARGEFYPEDYLIPYLAKRLRMPVCWTEDRIEHLKAINHSREQWHRVRLGVRRDGTIIAFDDRVLNDMGAYVRTHGVTVPTLTVGFLPGPYQIQNYRCEMLCVLTNKTPTGTYRGPGRYEAAFVRERLVDIVARTLKIDPADVRRRNFIQPDQMPYNVGTDTIGCNTVDIHTIYDSGDYPLQFEEALERIGYGEVQASCEAARAEGRAVGIGICCCVEKSGLGPWEYARVEVDSSGEVVVYTGVASVGQGIETILAQIAAEELGARFEQVRVVHGDTNVVPYGGGGFASRGAVVGGSATLGAARKVKQKLLQVVASALEIDPEDLTIEDGHVVVRGAPARSMTLGEAARLASPLPALRSGFSPGISEEDFFVADDPTYPYNVHIAVVEVDRETGSVTVQKYLVADDIGRALNPMIVEGQIVGGAAQGLGGALLEELAYDAGGQFLSGSFMDYLLPTALEVPRFDVLFTEHAPSQLNPLGVKGAGEGGIVGVGAAIANAVSDALGVKVTRLPLKPEYVRQLALRENGS